MASTSVVLAPFSNTLVKGGMAWVLGGRAFKRQVAGAFGAMIAGGVLGLVAAWLA